MDEAGVCSYCRLHERLDAEYPTGDEGEKRLTELAQRIRRAGKRSAYDVVVGVSGGCDSSFLLAKAIELGLRPLAVHFDNTWDSRIAVENIESVLSRLGVDLYTHVVDNEEYNDIYRAFLRAGVPDLEAPTDIGLAATLYEAAAKFNIGYIFEGHSFRTEGISPLGWLYMDGKYIESVVKECGHFDTHKLRTFPNLKMRAFLRHTLIRGTKKIRPLYWIDYHKEQAKQFLMDEFGWKWYGGHHLENRFTAFYHSYFLPRRFGIDQRVNGFSALIRSGQMTRREGLELMQAEPLLEPEIITTVKSRLGLDDAEFERVMTMPHRTYADFKTYKRTFERMRPLFYLMYKFDRVPKSFYIKYTASTEGNPGIS